MSQPDFGTKGLRTMARARNIKPGFFANEQLAECSLAARLLFIGIWTLADRNGRLEDRPKRIDAAIFPYDENIDCNSLLSELEQRGFIVRYKAQGIACIWITGFEKHQNPHRNEAESVLPPWYEVTSDQGTKPLLEATRADSLIPYSLNDDSLNAAASPQGTKRRRTKREPDADDFARFWKAFPSRRKKGKGAARKSWAKATASVDSETIIAAAVEYAASAEGMGEFAKMPATWLNQECWDDDREAWSQAGNATSGKPPTGKPRPLEPHEFDQWDPYSPTGMRDE